MNRAAIREAAAKTKNVLPGFLIPPVRLAWRLINRTIDVLQEKSLYVQYWLHRLSGGTFTTWYAKTLDKWAANDREKAPDLPQKKFEAGDFKAYWLKETGKKDLAVLT